MPGRKIDFAEPGAGRPDSVRAALSYVDPHANILRRFVATGEEVNTFGSEVHEVTIRNARRHMEGLTLDQAGFQLFHHRSAVRQFLDEQEVGAVYPREAVDLVKSATGADDAIVSNWNLRSASAEDVSSLRDQGRTGRSGRMQPPGSQVHIDQYPDAAERVARALYERERPAGPAYRRFINFSLWRTFSTPPQDRPLALCHFQSIRPDEGLRNTLIFGESIPDSDARNGPIEGEMQMPAATLFRYNPDHCWWFYPDMTRDEAILLKFHDTDQSVAWRVPHTAFVDPSASNPVPRQSIELRCTAYFLN